MANTAPANGSAESGGDNKNQQDDCPYPEAEYIGNTSGPRAEIDIRFIFGKQISLIGRTIGSHQDFLDVTALLWSGKLTPIIDRVMPLSQGRDAYALLEKGGQFGKIVLTPR